MKETFSGSQLHLKNCEKASECNMTFPKLLPEKFSQLRFGKFSTSKTSVSKQQDDGL